MPPSIIPSVSPREEPTQPEQEIQGPGSGEVAELQRQLAEERSARQTLEGRLRSSEGGRVEAGRRAMTERESRLAAQEQASDSAIASATTESDALKATLRALQKEGDFDKAADVQEQLADVRARLFNEKARKDWLAGERTRIQAEADQPQGADEPKTPNGVPLSAFPANVQAWIASHPRFMSDKGYHDLALSGHYGAVAKGLREGTPEYFEHVESVTGDRQMTTRREPEDEPAPSGEVIDYQPKNPQSRAAGPGSMAAVAVPPSRSPASGPGNSTRAPSLSSEEREIADALYTDKFPNPADRYTHYAANRTVMAKYKMKNAS